MAKQVAKSKLLAKYGPRINQAYLEHKDDEITYSQFGDLPAGIENGVARLIEAKFTEIAEGKQNAGELMFYAAGIVLVPKEVGGVPVEGLRTQISEPLFDTPSRARATTEDHWAWIMNELGKLGLDRDSQSPDTVEAGLEALKQAQPTFRFRTWAGTKQEAVQRGGKWYVMSGTQQQAGPYASLELLKAKNPYVGNEPRTNHTWNGTVDYEEQEDTEDVQDSNVAVNGQTKHKQPALMSPDEVPDATGGVVQGGESTELTLGELVELADSDNEVAAGEAQAQLNTMAEEAGVAPAVIKKAKTWQAVADLINEQAGASETVEDEPAESEAEPEAEFMPAKGEIYFYKPLDLKTKKPVTKAVECEVTLVNVAKSTVDLKSLDNPKLVYKGVAYDKLEGQ